MSHPVWVCGLKLVFYSLANFPVMSHPVWVCGLKPYPPSLITVLRRRTPCGCVD